MYNYDFLVGRLVRDIKVNSTDSGKSVANISLAVTRPFKNPTTNQADVDYINAVCWDGYCDTVAEYVHKGDTIGIKGRIQTRKEEINGKTYTMQEIIAEKVIFLSSNKQIEE